MTTIFGTNALAYGTRDNITTNNPASANDMLGKDDFLKLFTAQLSNQDPMSPMDNSNMMAQLAQFSLVEQMTNMSESLDYLKETMTGLNSQSLLTQGALLIGKEVVGTDGEGNMLSGEVSAVKWDEKGLLLKVGEGWLSMTQVSEIKEIIK